MSTNRISCVTTQDGRIIAFAPIGEPAKRGWNAAFGALPGQILHEIALPAELADLAEKPAELHHAMMSYRLRMGPAMSVLIPKSTAVNERKRTNAPSKPRASGRRKR